MNVQGEVLRLLSLPPVNRSPYLFLLPLIVGYLILSTKINTYINFCSFSKNVVILLENCLQVHLQPITLCQSQAGKRIGFINTHLTSVLV